MQNTKSTSSDYAKSAIRNLVRAQQYGEDYCESLLTIRLPSQSTTALCFDILSAQADRLHPETSDGEISRRPSCMACICRICESGGHAESGFAGFEQVCRFNLGLLLSQSVISSSVAHYNIIRSHRPYTSCYRMRTSTPATPFQALPFLLHPNLTSHPRQLLLLIPTGMTTIRHMLGSPSREHQQPVPPSCSVSASCPSHQNCGGNTSSSN